MIVGIILGLAMFIAGITLFMNIFSQAQEYDDEVSERIRQDILARFSSGDRVFIPETNQEADSDGIARYYIGVNNIESEEADFELEFEETGDVETVITSGTHTLGGRDKEVFLSILDASEAGPGQHSVLLNVTKDTEEYATRMLYITS